jgi:hypothetical protein
MQIHRDRTSGALLDETLLVKIGVIEGRGPAAVKQLYLDTLAGRVPPDQGHILSLAA